jgi:hypothetical protein
MLEKLERKDMIPRDVFAFGCTAYEVRQTDFDNSFSPIDKYLTWFRSYPGNILMLMSNKRLKLYSTF